jgi:hypothetical protein
VIIASGFAGSVVGATTADDVVDAFGSFIDQTVILAIITEVMTAAGAIVLVAVIARIEMRASARDEEIRAQLAPAAGGVLLPMGPVVADGGMPQPGQGGPAVTVSQPFDRFDAPPAAASSAGSPPISSSGSVGTQAATDTGPMAPPPPPPGR